MVSFGKHEPPKPGPGVQEFAADAVVQPHAARHFVDVGADLLAQIGDLVDEGDLGGEEGVGGVFDKLGGAPVDIEDRRRVEIKRPIELRDHGARAHVVGADDDAVGMLEILDRGALAQEFRIRHHLDVGVGARVAQDALDLVAGSDGHRRFSDDYRRGGEQRCDLAHRVIDKTQIGMAVAAA